MTYYYESELYHHGIKGQRCGLRRYQNEDGTLTELGKKRYDVGEELIKRTTKEMDNIPDSPFEKEREKFYRKHPDADGDDFDDVWFGYDEKKKAEQEEWEAKYDAKTQKLINQSLDASYLRNPSSTIDDGKVKGLVNSILLTPLSAVVSIAATKNVESGAKRAGIILASIGGTAVGTLLEGEISGRVKNRKLDKKYGIK